MDLGGGGGSQWVLFKARRSRDFFEENGGGVVISGTDAPHMSFNFSVLRVFTYSSPPIHPPMHGHRYPLRGRSVANFCMVAAICGDLSGVQMTSFGVT